MSFCLNFFISRDCPSLFRPWDILGGGFKPAVVGGQYSLARIPCLIFSVGRNAVMHNVSSERVVHASKVSFLLHPVTFYFKVKVIRTFQRDGRRKVIVDFPGLSASSQPLYFTYGAARRSRIGVKRGLSGTAASPRYLTS